MGSGSSTGSHQAQMWHLSDDRRSVRMELPGLSIEGMPESLRVRMHVDAGVVDQMIQRLLLLRTQMLPAQKWPNYNVKAWGHWGRPLNDEPH